MTFDRLIYIDRLKEAGLSESAARAHAEALRDALFETVATRPDLNEVRDELKEDLRAVRTELKEDIRGVRTELKEDIRAVRTEMKDGFEAVDRKIEILDRKIAITARDLTIKGAGGLIIIASIIIGLKLFG